MFSCCRTIYLFALSLVILQLLLMLRGVQHLTKLDLLTLLINLTDHQCKEGKKCNNGKGKENKARLYTFTKSL